METCGSWNAPGRGCGEPRTFCSFASQYGRLLVFTVCAAESDVSGDEVK